MKIGLEGEKEFKSVLYEINNSFKVLGNEISREPIRQKRQLCSSGNLEKRGAGEIDLRTVSIVIL